MKRQFSRVDGVLVVTHENGVSTFRSGNRKYVVDSEDFDSKIIPTPTPTPSRCWDDNEPE